jgi:hypothetical protein
MSILFLLNSAIYYGTRYQVNSKHQTRQESRNTQNSSGKRIYKSVNNGIKRGNILLLIIITFYILQLFDIFRKFTLVLHDGLRSHSISKNRTAIVIFTFV